MTDYADSRLEIEFQRMPTVSLDYSRGIYISCVLDISANFTEDGDEDGDVINNELRAGLTLLQNQPCVMENARRRTLKR